MLDQWWMLLTLGLLVGTLGTLIGVGGGFILVPVLLMTMPRANPSTVTAISLAVVFLNATSGAYAYFKMGRVDLKSAAWFALATSPGAVLGVLSTKLIPRHQFDVAFGSLLVAAAAYLIVRPDEPLDPDAEPDPRHTRREITDAEGTTHVYHFSMPIGICLSAIVGFLSSLLGIGGGIIHVPVLNRTLNFPVHVATATSHMILSIMALWGTLVHIQQGHLDGNYQTVAILGIGAVVGAQIGARLSNRLHGAVIIRSLAVALGLVGVRIFVMGFR